jgi:hypothetical protein
MNKRPEWMMKTEFWCKECLLVQMVNRNYIQIPKGPPYSITIIEIHDAHCSRSRFDRVKSEPFEVE